MSPRDIGSDLATKWTGSRSVTARILAVNIFALAMLAFGFFYLDSYRSRLIDQSLHELALQAVLLRDSIEAARPEDRARLAARLGDSTDLRVRFYGADGSRRFDSWQHGPPTYDLRDPSVEPFRRHVARFLDRFVDAVVGAPSVEPFVEPTVDRLDAWPETTEARATHAPATAVRRAPDRTLMLSAAIPAGSGALLVTGNARDITRTFRAERLRLGIVLLVVVLISILLSLFLARTIVRPLRRLAIAAQRVRLGRAREVQVPRLPARRDEIGSLARALHDMSQALRQRIDATEAFAADVTHELKNPLASLRSAVESMGRVSDPALHEQLLEVIREDVARLDRLITDISAASRVDAELARARFEVIDLGAMLEGIAAERERRGLNGDVRVAFARPHAGSTLVLGDGARLARVFENLLDNAVSFSPKGGLVRLSAMQTDGEILFRIDDEGPGVPLEAREAIFRRFHSVRPEGEAFGRHSGLGLAIARAIVDAHGGSIRVEDRDDAASGARFEIRLPAATEP